MSSEVVIQFEHVRKAYSKYEGLQIFKNLLDRIKNGQLFGKLMRVPDHVALDDVSFTIRHGEKVGIIGHNGAGKSTTLRLLAGVARPTEGKVFTKGLIGSVLDLGAGFHPDLTARDNIYLQGSTYGFGRERLEAMTDEILQISELHNFIDVPLKKFSSGMRVRLGFAIAMITSPDIVLLDEVLSVGDRAFKSKSLDLMKQFLRDKTLVLVSHSLKEVQTVCDRVIILSRGKKVFDGDVHEGIELYSELIVSPLSSRQIIQPKVKRGFAHAAISHIHELSVSPPVAGQLQGEVLLENEQTIPDLSLTATVFRLSSAGLRDLLYQFHQPLQAFAGKKNLSFSFDVSPLLPGNYELQMSPYVLGDDEHARELLTTTFSVESQEFKPKGVVDLRLHIGSSPR